MHCDCDCGRQKGQSQFQSQKLYCWKFQIKHFMKIKNTLIRFLFITRLKFLFYVLLTWNFFPSCTDLILCVSEGVLPKLLCIHIVGMGTFDLHAMHWFYVCLKASFPSCSVFTFWALEPLALMHWFYVCLTEGLLWKLLCIHIVGMGTFDLHALILCVFEGVLSE